MTFRLKVKYHITRKMNAKNETDEQDVFLFFLNYGCNVLKYENLSYRKLPHPKMLQNFARNPLGLSDLIWLPRKTTSNVYEANCRVFF